MTGREIKEAVDSFLHVEEVGNKHFDAFLQSKLVEDKKSFFELFCKARLITGNEIKKKFLKPLLVVKEVCQAFGLFVNKAIKFTQAFKYAVMSVRLVVATRKSTLYQPDKVGLRNYIINLSKTSSHEYLRDGMCVVDGMAAVRSVPPLASCNITSKYL